MSDVQTFENEASSSWFFNHLPTMIWQRKLLIIASTLLCFIAAVAAAYSLPTVYRSKATLLVQAQDLPSSIVQSPVSGGVEQRIAAIRERVLSRGDLIALIEQNDLYPDDRRTDPLSKVVEEMRKATSVSALSGELGDSSGGADKTIAVTLSFDYPDPGKAQAVLQNYVGSFMKIDSDDIEEQAQLSVRFLEDQAGKLQSQISEIENNITGLKARNGAALSSTGPGMIDTGSYSAQIASLENQNRQLLLSSRGVGKDSQLAAAETALATARARYSDSHPDVIQAEERVRQLRAMAASSVDNGGGDAIREQIGANNATIAQLTQQKEAALGRASAAMAGSARAPAIMEEAMQLESRASTLRDQFRVVSGDLLKAQNSARMAGEQRAERLSLVDAPSLPDTPTSPNRPLLILGGLVAGLGLGLFLALAAEFIFRPVRSPNQIEGIGLPVLGLVPILEYAPKAGPARYLKFWQRRPARAA